MSYFQFLAFATVVIFMPYLVFGFPFPKTNDQHPKLASVRPESVFLAWLDQEFIMFRRTIGPSVNLKVCT